MGKHNIEVCFTPALFEYHNIGNVIVVVVDILRATTSICTAFANGVNKIIPVESRNVAHEMKLKGYVVAAERNGYKLDFADFGNSPFNFSKENVEGKTIVYSTTNGTKTINKAIDCYQVIIGSFLNNNAIAEYLVTQNKDIIILCAGWKNKTNIEDTVFAGCLTEKLLDTKLFQTNCDSAFISLDLWQRWKNDLRTLIDKSAQRNRLLEKGLDDCIDYSLQLDQSDIVPIFKNNVIVSNLK
jgi:2-phosphosulfolactate phosphatase